MAKLKTLFRLTLTGPLYRNNEYISMARTPHPPALFSAIDFRAPQLDWGGGLTRYIRQRRQELGLTQECAAQLAGLELSQWYALESGWVPDMPEGMDMIQAIAGTLETDWAELSFLALMADLGLLRQ
jgi:DNA-binding XRE family transcriptional regulator